MIESSLQSSSICGLFGSDESPFLTDSDDLFDSSLDYRCRDISDPFMPSEPSSHSFHLDSLSGSNSLHDDIFSEFYSSDQGWLANLEWLSISPIEDSNGEVTVTVQMKGSANESKQIEPLDYFQSSNLWTNMPRSEQEATLQALSSIVTTQMSIREQIEIIKIIDPSVVLSPDCKEFVLDRSFFNDDKFKKIKDLIQNHKLHISTKRPNYFSKNTNGLINSSKSSKRPAESDPEKNSKQKKQKDLPPEEKQLVRKRQKQTRREEKSGLFVYEKKLKIDNDPVEEDEDINVLE